MNPPKNSSLKKCRDSRIGFPVHGHHQREIVSTWVASTRQCDICGDWHDAKPGAHFCSDCVDKDLDGNPLTNR